MNSIRRPLLILTTLGLLLPTARLPAMTDAEAASGLACMNVLPVLAALSRSARRGA